MLKMWPKVFVALILATPVAAIAEDKKKEPPPEQSTEAYKSQTHGAIQVKGDTDDWFTVYKGEKAITYPPPSLGKTAEVEPGEYDVVVNKTVRKVKVEAGKKVVLVTGTLLVEGTDGLYWYPKVGDERKVAGNRNNPDLNKAIALFPGSYIVEVNVNLRMVKIADAAQVKAGEKTTLKR